MMIDPENVTILNLISKANDSTTFPTFNDTTNITEEDLLLLHLGPKRKDLPSVILLLIIYSVIFVTGTVGNICTCIVIAKNNYMQTTTNYYLFSLAISDVLILLFGLPQEAYGIWEAYPYRFGEAFCIFKALLMEMTSYASILTITAFTIERYVAICHPLKAHKLADLRRSVKIIIAIWVFSLFCALPFPIHTQSFYYITNPNTGTPIKDSLQCNIPPQWKDRIRFMFQVSTFIFFVLPMTVITVLYVLIAITLRKTALNRAGSEEARGHNHASSSHSMKVVLRMLVAVVVAFFACWAPFHAQRLLTLYNTNWTHLLLEIQSLFFYISGVLYFVGSTVNPMLYNVISKRYREAFKETLCCCVLRKRTSFFKGSMLTYNNYQNSSLNHTPRLTKKIEQKETMIRASQSNRNERPLKSDESIKSDSGDPLSVRLLSDTGYEHCNGISDNNEYSSNQCKNGNEVEHCPTCSGARCVSPKQHNTMVTAPNHTRLLNNTRENNVTNCGKSDGTQSCV